MSTSIADKIKKTVDLQRGVDLHQLGRLFGSDETLGHEFIITVLDGGEPVDLTGATIAGYFFKPDGLVEPILGEENTSVDGNTVTVRLTAPCYTATGRFTFTIRANHNGVIHTIYYATGTVTKSYTDKADTSGVVKTLDEINAEILALKASIPADYTELTSQVELLTDTVDAIIETEAIAIEKTINAYFNGAELVGASYGRVAYANVQGYKRVTVTKAAGSTFVIGFTTNVPTNHNSIIGLVYNNTGTELSADVPENGNYIVILFYNSNKDTATPEELLASINITGLVGAVDSKVRTQIDDIEEAFNNANDFSLTNYANGACGELTYNNNPFATYNYVFSGRANTKAFCVSGNPSLPPTYETFTNLSDDYFSIPLEAGKSYTLVMYATTEQTASGRITFYFADRTTKTETKPELDPVANNGKITTKDFTVPTTDMYALKVYPRTGDNRTVRIAILPPGNIYQLIKEVRALVSASTLASAADAGE